MSHTIWFRAEKAPRIPEVVFVDRDSTNAPAPPLEGPPEVMHACFRGVSLNEIYFDVMHAFNMAGNQPSQFGDTRELMNCFIAITDPRRRFILDERRKHSLIYLIGELIWYVSGEETTERIENYSKFWSRLINPETRKVNSNYGYKIFHKLLPLSAGGERKTQFDYVYDELKRDPTSRRAVVLLNLSDDDYHQMHTTKDFPCTMYLHFIIRGGQLDLLVHMRSNDFILGFTNDMPFFTVLQELMAVRLGVPLGNYYHFSDSMHLYERNYDLLPRVPYTEDEYFEKPFPLLMYEDYHLFPSWPTVEKYIREKKDSLLDIDYELPSFTRFIYMELLKHWTKV